MIGGFNDVADDLRRLSKSLQLSSTDVNSLRLAVRFLCESNAMLFGILGTFQKKASLQRMLDLLALHASSTFEFIQANFPPKFSSVDYFKLIGDEAARYVIGFLSPQEIGGFSSISKNFQRLSSAVIFSLPFLFQFDRFEVKCYLTQSDNILKIGSLAQSDVQTSAQVQKCINQASDVKMIFRNGRFFDIPNAKPFLNCKNLKKLHLDVCGQGQLPRLPLFLSNLSTLSLHLGSTELANSFGKDLYQNLAGLPSLTALKVSVEVRSHEDIEDDSGLTSFLQKFNEHCADGRIKMHLTIFAGGSSFTLDGCCEQFFGIFSLELICVSFTAVSWKRFACTVTEVNRLHLTSVEVDSKALSVEHLADLKQVNKLDWLRADPEFLIMDESLTDSYCSLHNLKSLVIDASALDHNMFLIFSFISAMCPAINSLELLLGEVSFTSVEDYAFSIVSNVPTDLEFLEKLEVSWASSDKFWDDLFTGDAERRSSIDILKTKFPRLGSFRCGSLDPVFLEKRYNNSRVTEVYRARSRHLLSEISSRSSFTTTSRSKKRRIQ
jgi:hypothetical protein